MRIIIFILLLILGCNGHEVKSNDKDIIPQWLIGKWSNYGCSDINKTIVVEFLPNQFFVKNNIFMEKENIKNKHHNNKIMYLRKNDYWGAFFIDGIDTTSYEFQLTTIGNKEALLWHFNKLGEERGFFSKDVSIILQKWDK